MVVIDHSSTKFGGQINANAVRCGDVIAVMTNIEPQEEIRKTMTKEIVIREPSPVNPCVARNCGAKPCLERRRNNG